MRGSKLAPFSAEIRIDLSDKISLQVHQDGIVVYSPLRFAARFYNPFVPVWGNATQDVICSFFFFSSFRLFLKFVGKMQENVLIHVFWFRNQGRLLLHVHLPRRITTPVDPYENTTNQVTVERSQGHYSWMDGITLGRRENIGVSPPLVVFNRVQRKFCNIAVSCQFCERCCSTAIELWRHHHAPVELVDSALDGVMQEQKTR